MYPPIIGIIGDLWQDAPMKQKPARAAGPPLPTREAAMEILPEAIRRVATLWLERYGTVVYGLVCKFRGHGMREVGPTPCPVEGPYHDREEA